MMEKKRIAFVIYSLSTGGAERVISTLANSLEEEFDVSIITLVKTEPFYPLKKSIKLLYCAENPKTRTNPIKSTVDGLSRTKTLSKIIKRNGIQLTISFMTSSNIYAIWASKLCGIPCIISERANHAIDKPPKLLVLARNFTYKLCNYLIVQTEGNKAFYNRILPPSKVKIIPNPISDFLVSKKKKIEETQKEKIILNVGSFKEGKAQDLLIRAFSSIKTDDWQVVFVGDGKNKPKFIELTKELKFQDKIRFVGKQRDIHKYYNQASLFVFTSEHEGFPNALLEALYFGLPSISTNCKHGPSDLIEDGDNGILIPVGDQKTLEKKMSLLMKDLDLQHKFRKNAIASTEKYETKNILSLWLSYINELI